MKNAKLKNSFFYFSNKTCVVGAQISRPNEMVLLNKAQVKLTDEKISTILHSKRWLNMLAYDLVF